MYDTIVHCAILRLVEARVSARSPGLTPYGKHLIAGRALRALYSVSRPVSAVMRVYLLIIHVVAAAPGAGVFTRFLAAAERLPVLRQLNLLIYSWVDLCCPPKEAQER